MALTKKEQKTFEKMFDDLLAQHPRGNKIFLRALGDLLFDMTGSVNLKMRLFNISLKSKND